MTAELAFVHAPGLVCVLACGIGAVTDLRGWRIPNWLTFGAMALGLVLNFALATAAAGLAAGLRAGLLPAAAGCAFSLVAFALFSALGSLGMGDVKLMGAVGALLRWPLAMWATVYVLLAGGLLALLTALRRGRLRAALANLGRGQAGEEETEAARSLHRIRYGLAIFAGVAWVVLARYVPALRIP